MKVVGLAIAFLILSLLFGIVEKVAPANPAQPPFFRRRGFRTDLVYWFFTPIVTRTLTFVAILIVFVAFAAKAGVTLDREHLRAFSMRATPFTRQRRGVQVLEILFFGDLLAYWQHRFFHARPLWKFHAVHHCSRDLDWLSATRLHPINDVLARLFQVVPALFLGFDKTVLAAYMPFLTFWAIAVHANVPWTLGPFRYVIASPVFHRWHHTTDQEGLDKNFSGLFPIWDLVFGTFYMPKGKLPREFGVSDAVPEGLFAQLAWPFRHSDAGVARTSMRAP